MEDYADEDIPRRIPDPDPVRAMVEGWNKQEDRTAALERGSPLRNASITGGEGLSLLDVDGSPRVWLRPGPTGGVVEAYDEDGEPVVRMGRMYATGPAAYGIEIRSTGGWVQVGNQTVDWANVANKPSTFPVNAHMHPGSDITSSVANAAWAQDAVWATHATGSPHAYNNNVAGTSFYQVWVGNNSGNTLGRNTSARRYKMNITDYDFADPEGVLKLRPVRYDRRPTYEAPAYGVGPYKKTDGPKNEIGLIAEEVAEAVPEIVTYYEGQIDGVRYDLLGLALLPVVRSQRAELDKLRGELNELAAAVKQLKEAS